jgi:hypothetical protein
MIHRFARVVALLGACAVVAGCGDGKTPGVGTCAELGPDADTLGATFSGDALANGRLRVFIQAVKDSSWAAAELEHEIAGACHRMGVDVGIPESQMRPANGPGGAASGACEPVALRIDAVIREGVRLWVTIQPPVCSPNGNAWTRCSSRCDAARDPECQASCKAHSNVHAACDPARVSVRALRGATEAGSMLATLQANLPTLVNAQMALGQRLQQEVQTVAQVGARLQRSVGDAGSKAVDCAGAGADAAAQAMMGINVSVRASTLITSRLQ